jgi:hypothetical protein
VVLAAGDRPAQLVLDDGATRHAVPASALSRGTTAPWVWVLVPWAAAFDVLATPAMIFLAVPLLVVGD